jgi:hypothetical protein
MTIESSQLLHASDDLVEERAFIPSTGRFGERWIQASVTRLHFFSIGPTTAYLSGVYSFARADIWDELSLWHSAAASTFWKFEDGLD